MKNIVITSETESEIVMVIMLNGKTVMLKMIIITSSRNMNLNRNDSINAIIMTLT